MSDTTTKTILSVCATVASRLPDLAIKNGQLVFIQDKQMIALDYGGKRVFYNQINLLDTEDDRLSIIAPVSGLFYFVIKTAVLWTYQDSWIQITSPPKEVLFIGTELPELGTSKTLYVDTANKEISVWDSEQSTYIVVADSKGTISESEIDSLFK